MQSPDLQAILQELSDLSAREVERIEYELAYRGIVPPAGDFARDLLYVDREIRRTARLAVTGRLDAPFYVRRRARPLPVASGLRVREGHQGSFSFFLDLPPGIYHVVLSLEPPSNAPGSVRA